MQNNNTISVEKIIAKIDNDFNPDGSDWIPRVISWTIDAMGQLDVLRIVSKKRRLAVINNIARTACPFSTKGLKVYDDNGCEVSVISARCGSCSSPSPTGEQPDKSLELSNTMSIVDTGYNGKETYGSLAIHNNTPDVKKQATVVEEIYSAPRRGCEDRGYVLVDDHTIEINFDAKYIDIISNEVETEYSEYYKCDIPVIPNNYILIEAIGYYCMYKMLCRGMKHPVFNLGASQYGTNPYYQWEQLKNKAKAGVIIDWQAESGNKDGDAWRSYFYNYTFPK